MAKQLHPSVLMASVNSRKAFYRPWYPGAWASWWDWNGSNPIWDDSCPCHGTMEFYRKQTHSPGMWRQGIRSWEVGLKCHANKYRCVKGSRDYLSARGFPGCLLIKSGGAWNEDGKTHPSIIDMCMNPLGNSDFVESHYHRREDIALW